MKRKSTKKRTQTTRKQQASTAPARKKATASASESVTNAQTGEAELRAAEGTDWAQAMPLPDKPFIRLLKKSQLPGTESIDEGGKWPIEEQLRFLRLYLDDE